MIISEAIAALTTCLANFGDAEVKFVQTAEGNPAIELHDVDTTVAAAVSAANSFHQAALLFNARFPTKGIFIPSRN